MKKYTNPELEILNLCDCDIITSSQGTETPTYDETDPDWH